MLSQNESGAELFAATCAASADNLAATDSFLTGEESVAAGAHKIAGLKSTLHNNLEGEIKRAAHSRKSGTSRLYRARN